MKQSRRRTKPEEFILIVNVQFTGQTTEPLLPDWRRRLAGRSWSVNDFREYGSDSILASKPISMDELETLLLEIKQLQTNSASAAYILIARMNASPRHSPGYPSPPSPKPPTTGRSSSKPSSRGSKSSFKSTTPSSFNSPSFEHPLYPQSRKRSRSRYP